MQKQLLREQRDLWNGTGGSWAQGYRAGNLVFLQGQTGLTLDGEVVAPGDPAGQARLALENIRTLMELAGGSLADVVKIVVYVTEHAYRGQVYPIIDEFFGALKPCSTGLVVNGLALPELVVEIDAYAVIDGPAA
jgi:enamine deaminase RidA (YjgF/YER057c/UK114 family)